MDLGSALHPPAYGSDDDDAAPRPGFCLLEKDAYLNNRQNATTAVCDLEDGTIQVTFCTAEPPRTSYFCVDSTACRPSKSGMESDILATEGPLALIRVIIGQRKFSIEPGEGEYFVYHAGNLSEGRGPSLKHIPLSACFVFDEFCTAIVRHCPRRPSTKRGRLHRDSVLLPHEKVSEEEDHDCGDCNYVIAAPRSNLQTVDCYELLLYHSKTETWSAPAPALMPGDGLFLGGDTCKAISIGGDGGTVAWSDLDQCIIIFCDVLAITDDGTPPVFRCLDLPPRHEPVNGSSGCIRDIALLDGFISYTEVEVFNTDIDKPRKDYRWNATNWRIKVINSMAVLPWHMECAFDSLEISKSLRGKLQVHDEDTIFYIGYPYLSLRDDSLVYMLSETNLDTKQSFLLAIDMKENNIREVVLFGTQRVVCLGKDLFISSRISKYLQVIAGITKQTPKRQKMALQGQSFDKQPGIPMISRWDDDDNDHFINLDLLLQLQMQFPDKETFKPIVKQPRTKEEAELWAACKKT